MEQRCRDRSSAGRDCGRVHATRPRSVEGVGTVRGPRDTTPMVRLFVDRRSRRAGRCPFRDPGGVVRGVFEKEEKGRHLKDGRKGSGREIG